MSKPGMLTVEELERLVDVGEVDTVLVAITDMQGRLQGKRLHARYFLDEVLAHGTEGCNYLLAVDVDMNTVDGYAMSSWATGLRRLRHDPRPVHAAPRAVAAGHRHADRRPRLARRVRRGRLAPADPQAADRAAGRAGMQAFAGTELEFIVFNDTYEEAWKSGLPRPHPGQPVQRRLLDARHRPRRAAAAPDPQRDGRRRPDRRVGQGRVQPRPARDRLPVRRRDHRVRQPRDLQERRQGDRGPGGSGAHLHGQVRPARGQLLPHPPELPRHRRRAGAWPTTATRSTACPRWAGPSSPGSSRTWRS